MKFSFESENKFYEFVENNLAEDPRRLYLAVSGKDYPFPVQLAVEQIECRRKTAKKLSTFLACSRFLFPSVLSAEQATHQCVAAYHESLLEKEAKVADLTAGLGIDCLTFARNGHRVIAVELDADRVEMLNHNKKSLSLSYPEVMMGDSMIMLNNNKIPADIDVIFIDPARRDDLKKRVFRLDDCLPDVVANCELLLSHAPKVMIKSSPLLDISQALRSMKNVAEIHLVCVRGECKELLMILDRNNLPDSPIIKSIDLEETADASLLIRSEFAEAFDNISSKGPVAETAEITTGAYIYDPVSAVHKMNCAANLCERFAGLKKISPGTDIFVSSEYHPGFPGRIFKIKEIPGKREQKSMKGKRMEIISRNYPLKAEEIRKKLGLQSGDESFLIAIRATNKNTPTMLVCESIKRV